MMEAATAPFISGSTMFTITTGRLWRKYTRHGLGRFLSFNLSCKGCQMTDCTKKALRSPGRVLSCECNRTDNRK